MGSATRRVVVTGMGVVSPLGTTADALWGRLSSGQSGVGPLTVVPADAFPTSVAAEAREFQGKMDDFGPLPKDVKRAIRKGLRVMCRECQMGVAVAQKALADAGLEPGQFDPERVGISFGSDYMITEAEEFNSAVHHCRDAQGRFDFKRWATDGLTQMSPLWLLKYLPNMPASHLAIFNDLRGPNNSLTLREAVVGAVVGEAFHIIAEGRADAMLVGATGTRIHPIKMIHATQHEQLTPGDGDPAEASKPFDRDRSGQVLGEGAAAMILEELSHAQARGAAIAAEVLGGACRASIGPNMLARREQALVNAITAALRIAKVQPGDVGHVQAHGLATRSCDVDEAKAIQRVFGGRSQAIPVTTPKGHFGNLGAGGGMVELICGVLSLRHDRLLPVRNFRTPDPECPISPVTGDGTRPGDLFVKLAVNHQGQASAAVVRRLEG